MVWRELRKNCVKGASKRLQGQQRCVDLAFWSAVTLASRLAAALQQSLLRAVTRP